MKWVKRGLWVATWGVWVWCGFGLARHLPMKAEVLCRLHFKDGETQLCFLDGGKEFATISAPKELGPSTIHVLDSTTGKVKRELAGPLTQEKSFNCSASPCSPHLVTNEGSRPGHVKVENANHLAIMDLRTGAWSRMPVEDDGLGVFHRRRPWCTCRSPEEDPVLTVVDLEAKKVLLEWKPMHGAWGRTQAGHAFFLGDDRIGIPITRKAVFGLTSKALEIWSLADPKKPPQVFENIEVPYGPEASFAGTRIAWGAFCQGTESTTEVFDVDLGRLILPKTQPKSDDLVRRFGRRPLSQDGRSVLFLSSDPGRAKLLEVETGKVIWKAAGNESAFIADGETDRFLVFEDWRFGLTETEEYLWNWAVRSLKDGSLLFRCWSPPFNPARYVSQDGTYFFVHKGHEIQRLPYRIDWPLLALCQTILALPLVMLWAGLRWRRKRRMRMASVAT